MLKLRMSLIYLSELYDSISKTKISHLKSSLEITQSYILYMYKQVPYKAPIILERQDADSNIEPNTLVPYTIEPII